MENEVTTPVDTTVDTTVSTSDTPVQTDDVVLEQEVIEDDTFLDTFAWDVWDGEINESIPEKYKPLATKLSPRIKEAGELRSAHSQHVEELTAFYKSLVDAPGDIDLKKLAGVEKKYTELMAEHDKALQQNNALYTKYIIDTEAREARELADKQAYLAKYKEKHKDILSNKETAELLKRAMAGKFNLDEAAEVAGAGKEVASKALELHEQGVPANLCLNLARQALKPQTVPKVNPSQSLVDGADTVSPNSDVEVVTDVTKMGTEAARHSAVDKAFARLKLN